MTRTAIQGIAGSYSDEAAAAMLGDAYVRVECATFADALRVVADGKAECAVLPLENSITGRIDAVQSLLTQIEHSISSQYRLVVSHVVAGTPDSLIDEICEIRSHQEALRQCKKYLASNSGWKISTATDTATGIKEVIRIGAAKSAAICSPRAAAIYGAAVLATNIADSQENYTTFGMISLKGK